MDTEVLIIGGGLSGLSTAFALSRLGIRVRVWEADERVGGLIRSRREAGYLTERAAALVLNFRPEVTRLLGDCGLAVARVGGDAAQRRRRYLVKGGRLRAVPARLPALLLSDLWSPYTKVRVLTEILAPRREIDGESVADFIRRRLGPEILESAIDPYVAGTLAGDPAACEARSTLPRLTGLESRYGSIGLGVLVNRLLRRRNGQVQETFSFAGGMQQLTDTLAQAPGVSVDTRHAAIEMIPAPQGWRVLSTGPSGPVECRSRQLVLSIPAARAAALLAPLDTGLGRLLGEIRYAPLAVVHLGFERRRIAHPLDGIGFLTARRDGLNVNGNLWLGSLFPERAPPGHTLLTSYLGGARHPERADWDDQQLIDAVLADLERLLGLGAPPVYARIDRHPEALPQYAGHYSARLGAIAAGLRRLPGIELAANYSGGVSARDRMVQGIATASRIAERLREGTRRRVPRPLLAASAAVR